jgi:hypothetical protein
VTVGAGQRGVGVVDSPAGLEPGVTGPAAVLVERHARRLPAELVFEGSLELRVLELVPRL